MKIKFCIILVVLVTIFSINGVQNSFGHGLGTETMPPVMINGKSATLEVGSSTERDSGIQQITITLFETGTDNPIKNTLFEVELIKSNKSLFKNNFEREDGILIMNLVPSENLDVEILNQETFASIFGLASDQFNVKGKMFENGGLYKFNIKIIGIDSFDNILLKPVNYNLGISIPETTYYEIDDDGFGKQQIGVRTYYEQVSDFNYDATKKLITITMPFDWNEETIIQSSIVHEEILVPKTFGVFLVTDFVVYLNGILLPETVINIDDFSDSERTIHVVVSQKELNDLFQNKLVDETDEIFKLEVMPSSNDLPLTGITENGQFKINFSWTPSKILSNSTVNFNYEILDVFLKDRPIKVPYNVKIFYENEEIFSRSDVSSGIKLDNEVLEFFIPSDISGIIQIQFDELGGSEFARLSFPILVNDDTSSSSIPNWVKNNAGWWADGEIPDSAFVNGIQYLIKVGIIVIEQETVEEQTMVESINLSIISPPKFDNHFEKYVEVFGIPIYATANTPDDKVLHAANVLAQYLDNDVDGTPDNPLVVEKIKANDGGIPLFSGEDIDDNILYTANDEYTEYCWVALYADEINPRNGFDASLEEILHMITECGYANAYPEIFGEHEDSLIAEYMNNARGGFFDQIPRSYPSDAWYTYDDYTCDYRCMITEYFYWSMTSILGAHENRLSEIGQEWKLNTKEKIMEGDPDIYNLLTEPEYKFPTILPDGNYQG